jgi:hypothetical protein
MGMGMGVGVGMGMGMEVGVGPMIKWTVHCIERMQEVACLHVMMNGRMTVTANALHVATVEQIQWTVWHGKTVG